MSCVRSRQQPGALHLLATRRVINEGMRSEVTAETTDEQIRELAEEWVGLEQNYEDLVVVLDGDVDDAIRYITEYRDELRDE